MAKKNSQLDLYDHSEAKVTLLKKYLEAFLTIIGHSSHYGVVHLFDLFCGEGLYPNGGKGSPLIITETIKEIRERSNNHNLQSTVFNFLANDLDVKSLANVKKYFDENPEMVNWVNDLKFSNTDYKEFIPQLSVKFKKLKGEKAFVFIDPYGYKDISVLDIKALLSGKNSEVLLFLPTQFMYRFDNSAAPASLIQFISELNPKGDWQQGGNGLEFIDNLKDAFSSFLEGNYFVDAFRIAKAKNEYFCLFFFTSHIYGFHKMIEAKWSIDEEDGRGWTPEDYITGSGQLNAFTHAEKEPQTNPLEGALRGYLTQWRSNKELYEFTLRKGFLPKHATPILKEFLNNGKIDREQLCNTVKRKAEFYLTYDNYKRDIPVKIRVKLKNS
ncbi:MAG: three-Cys-motif partner protein TcmP [Crocinitomix sp.]|nr:three-Cys-motif partner protein TcmP [Crocinitomix sp.]